MTDLLHAQLRWFCHDDAGSGQVNCRPSYGNVDAEKASVGRRDATEGQVQDNCLSKLLWQDSVQSDDLHSHAPGKIPTAVPPQLVLGRTSVSTMIRPGLDLTTASGRPLIRTAKHVAFCALLSRYEDRSRRAVSVAVAAAAAAAWR